MADIAHRKIPDRLASLALLVLTLVSVSWWWTTLSRVAGGADSYGYVSTSQVILRGSLVQRPAEIDRLPLERAYALAVATPLGYGPSLANDGIVPTYPTGLPMLMALATLAAGSSGPFYVAPVMGMLGLVLVYGIARVWFDALTAWLAVAWVAWNPLYVAYAKQPMSDVPATALLLASIYLLAREHARPVPAGVAAGAAFLTRPALVTVCALGIGAWHHFTNYVNARRILLRYGSIFALAVMLQLTIHWRLYGHPLQSGYGSPATLFSVSMLSTNVALYGKWIFLSHGALWLVAVALGLLYGRAAAPKILALGVALSVAAPYLLYFEYDHWETLRFVLPGLVALTIAAAGGVTTLLRLALPAWLVALAVVGCGATFAIQSNRWLDRTGTWRLGDSEDRYPMAARWIAEVTPSTAMVIAGQHSGSIRYYAGRFTLRWDILRPEDLVSTVRHLNGQGIAVFAAFEGVEHEQFQARFKDVLGQVDLLPAGQARGIIVVEVRLK